MKRLERHSVFRGSVLEGRFPSLAKGHLLAGGALFGVALLATANASGLTLEVDRPAATEWGGTTSFEATIGDASGDVEIRWDFGDGNEAAFATGQEAVEHEYAAPGHYAVIVVAKDENGFSSMSFVQTVHRSVTAVAPSSSTSILFDPERRLVCNVNPDNDTVSLIDADSLEKVGEIPVYSKPEALALMPSGLLWVLHRDDYAIALVDLDERRIVRHVRLPRASQPMGLAVSPTGDAAYVTLMATGRLLRLDVESGETLESLDVGPFARGVAVSHDGETVYVTRFISPDGRGEVTEVDAHEMKVVRTIALDQDTTTEDTDQQGRGLPNYLFSISISPDGTQAWVPGKKDNMSRGILEDGLALTQDNTLRPMVGVLDLGAGVEDFGRRIDLDDRNLPGHVTFSPLGDYAFVSVIGSGLVEVRDAYTNDFVTAFRDPGVAPRATVLDDQGRLFVHAGLSRTIAAYDVADILSGDDQLTKKLADIGVVETEKLPVAVLRGKQIFYDSEDKRMTQEGYISCASCHFEGFEDGRVWEFTDRGEGRRNTTSLLGREGMGQGRVHWSGNFDEIQDFEGAIRGNFGGTGFLSDEDWEAGSHSDPLGDPKAGLSPELDALALYVASLTDVPPSPFKNADGSFTEEAEQGRELFLELGCDGCHSGAEFTDSAEGELHDVGTIQESSGARLGEELTGLDTPTLLGVWQTAPYLHDGSAATLRDVLTTRNPEDRHGETSALSDEEVDTLVAYLMQLDGGEVPTVLSDLEDEAPTSRGEGGGGCAVTRSKGSTPALMLLVAIVLAWARRLQLRRRLYCSW